jgi:hypothetical protein
MSGDKNTDYSVNFEKVPVEGRPVKAVPVMADPEVTIDGVAPLRRLLGSRADFQAGIAELLALAQRTVRIFDPDLADYGFNAPAAEEKLNAFLLASRANRLMIVVHDTQYITQSCPRLMRLLRQYSHAISIYQTHEAIRNVEDVLMVVDDAHYLRRPQREQYNGVIVMHDAGETRGWLNRFGEIWEQSAPAVSATTIGL